MYSNKIEVNNYFSNNLFFIVHEIKTREVPKNGRQKRWHPVLNAIFHLNCEFTFSKAM